MIALVFAPDFAAAQITLDPSDYANGQVITAPGVTLQTETFGVITSYGEYAPILSPVYAYTASCVISAACPPVGTNLFAPLPTGGTPASSGYSAINGFWGATDAAVQCSQNCMLSALDSNLVYLRLTFANPISSIDTLAFSSAGDPTVITAFDSAGNIVGDGATDVGSNYGWGYASITTATADISTVLIGAADSYQAINEISYSVPEIDTASAASGLTLLLSGLLILRGRGQAPRWVRCPAKSLPP